MAFFLVMWIIGLDVNTKQGIAAYFNQPGAFRQSFASSRNVLKMDGRPPPQPEQVDENDILTKYIDLQSAKTLQMLLQDQVNRDVAFKDRQHNVSFTLNDKGLQIDLIDDARRVYFQPESDTLNPAVRPLVLSLGQVLAKSGKPIRITGHVDAGKPGADPSVKMALGLGRARAVYQALAEGGLPPALCRQVSSRSDHNPKTANDRGNVANNRVTILVPYEAE
jgi:flagellar motor protein MotB